MSPRGSALPMVLGCTTLAMIVATIAWERAATRRLGSGREILVAQAEQGALAGLAVALHRLRAPGDTLDSLALHARFWQETRVRFLAEPLEGGLFPRARGTGLVPWKGDTLRREVTGTWGTRPDSRLFGNALVLFQTAAPFPDGLALRGAVRVPAAWAGQQGRLPVEGLSGPEYYAPGIGQDTVRLPALYLAALPSEEAHFGGGRIDPSRPAPPGRQELVFTRGDLEISAPEGKPWSPGAPRRLVVEGRVDIHGPVDLTGWTLLCKGPVVLDGAVRWEHGLLWSQGPVRLDGSSRFQGELLARGHLVLAGETQVSGPSALVVLPGTSPDTGSVLRLDGSARVEGYLLARGVSGLLQVGPQARLRGVGIAANLAIDGTVEGCAVGNAAQGSGTVDRTRMPADMALPAGLGRDTALVLVRKEFR